jgi:hypothetical protein
MTNQIPVIGSYPQPSTWVFHDTSVGLKGEPFVFGIPEMIQYSCEMRLPILAAASHTQKSDSRDATASGSYAEGEAELEIIAKAIEHGEIVIDKLSLAVKRADFLNRHLEQQLVGIEEALKQLGQQGKNPNDPKP